jgi:hypothetical protein
LKNKKHIIIFFCVVLIIIIIGVIAGKITRPKSYGEHGNYRYNAVEELQNQKIINQDIITCSECHKEIYQLHEKDAHYNVPCVDCHGPGDLHTQYHQGGEGSGNISKEQAAMQKEYKFEGCLYCHRKLKAKPFDFPQVDKNEHYKFLNVTNPETKCIECHSPHEPVFLLTDARQARLHPVVYKCTDCHEQKPEKSHRDVPGHPSIFECRDCHSQVVKDFNDRSHHNYVDCRTCHLYHRENETTGRIYKNGNAKFCLLCHEKKPFKDEKYPPKIEWSTHIGNPDIVSKGDAKICLNCHVDKIHKMDLLVKADPHPENWKSIHRETARQNLSVCMNCHTMNQCYSCHMKNKPASHNFNWRKQHSKIAASNKSSCEICHRKDGCFSCHKTEMPHPKDWQEKHKDFISKNGKTICNNCHKEEFCKQCH